MAEDRRSATLLPGMLLLNAPLFRDARGSFCQLYPSPQSATLDTGFVQENVSHSTKQGVVRGLHFQKKPHAQAKLIQVLQGRIFDVAVDLRRQSPSFGRHCALEMAADGQQIFVPAGFAHGFQTLADDTIVFYKVSHRYEPGADAGIHWADPALGIAWPLQPQADQISDKDRQLPNLRNITGESLQ